MTIQRILFLTAWTAHLAAGLGCNAADTPVCNAKNDAIVCDPDPNNPNGANYLGQDCGNGLCVENLISESDSKDECQGAGGVGCCHGKGPFTKIKDCQTIICYTQ